MADPGLTSTGYVAIRAIDARNEMIANINAYLTTNGLEPFDPDYDIVQSMIIDVFSAKIGEVGEATQALWDVRRLSAAIGQALDDIGALRGLRRLAATHSEAYFDLDGTTGTVIPDGSQIQCPNPDGTFYTWTLLETCTLPRTVGTDGPALFRCTVDGPIVAADASVDDCRIVTAVRGWTTVTLTTDVPDQTTGRALESDAAYRARLSTGPGRGNTVDGLRNALAAVDGVLAAVVIDNKTASTATISGISVPAHTVVPVVFPATLTTDQKTAVAQAIYDKEIFGIGWDGTESADVVRDNGQVVTVNWRYAADLDITVAITLVYEPGYTLSDVEDAVTTAVETMFGAFLLGERVTILDIMGLLADITGIRGAAVTLNGVASDVQPTAIQHPNLLALTVV
jgi:hypothetical protein